jgi:PRTRC genetic system protein B
MQKQFIDYKLQSALMVYVGGNGLNQSEFYVESHKVEDGVLSEGKPLTKDSIKKMVKSFYKSTQQESFSLFPTKLLAKSDNILLWFTPSQQQNIFFVPRLNIPDGKAFVPAMLWKLQDSCRLSVFALKSNRRPNYRSKIYHAPFHNVNSDVCMGSAKVQKRNGSVDQIMHSWEHAFWNSRFSEIHGNPLKENHNINLLWKELIQTEKPFPKEVLKPYMVKTLGELIGEWKRIF